MAVALVKLSDTTFAKYPMAVLNSPVLLEESAPTPIAVLDEPEVLSARASTPIAVLPSPVVLE